MKDQKLKSTIFLSLVFLWLFPQYCMAATDTEKISVSICEMENASIFVRPSLMNQKQIVTTRDGKEEITFIGTVKDKNERVLFYVLTMYSEVPAAIQVHGHSAVIFLDADKKIKKKYELGEQKEFPLKLNNNALYFRYIDAKTNTIKTYINKVGTDLPKLLCVAPDNCY